VATEVALAVAIDVESSNHNAARRWIFPNAGADGFAAPGNVARETYVNRYKLCYQSCSCSRPGLMGFSP
jgi:hypothetical protein